MPQAEASLPSTDSLAPWPTQVFQDNRRKLANHPTVHAQRAERGVQVVGVLHVTQHAVQARGLAAAALAEHAAQGAEAAQGVAAGELVQARYAFGQLRVITAAQFILGQAQHCAGTTNGLLRGHVQLRGQCLQQTSGL